MDIVLQREEYLYANDSEVQRLKNAPHSVELRVHYHEFVNPKERQEYLSEEINANGLFFIWRGTPKLQPPPKIYDRFPKSGTGVWMYLIYFDKVDKMVKMKCARVENNLELGSKHMTLSFDIDRTSDEVEFAAAGEARFTGNFTWEFNHFSGTYTTPRIEIRHNEGFRDPDDSERFLSWNNKSQRELETLLKSIDDYTLTKVFLKVTNPTCMFVFSSEEFQKEQFPLTELLRALKRPEDMPYCVPATGMYDILLETAVSTIHAFKNLRLLTPKRVSVNANATNDIETSISMADVDNGYRTIRKMSRPGPKSVPGSSTLVPSRRDLKLATRMLSKLGAKRIGYSGVKFENMPAIDKLDYFELTGSVLQIDESYYEKQFSETHTLKLERFLASSNQTVYLGTMDNQKVVLKITSCYPWHVRTKGIGGNTFKDDEAFYGTKTLQFVLPDISAVGNVLPYLGVTIKELPLHLRKPKFKQFKRQYLKQLWKTINTRRDTFAYRDVKPANTTMDESGNFHLIDLDKNAFTPQYYGPGEDNTFYNVMFGVLLVFNWFLTDKNPFQNGNTSPGRKLQWVADEIEVPEVQKMFDILNGTTMDNEDKFERILLQCVKSHSPNH